MVAAAFTFAGRAYLAIDRQAGSDFGTFDDGDSLFDVTGATGTLDAGDFGRPSFT